jgi:hypothetical protein
LEWATGGLGIVKAPAIFGEEGAIMDKSTSQITAVTASPVVVLELTRADFHKGKESRKLINA